MRDWWVSYYWDKDPVFLGSWIIWVIFSICLHELGHGFAAIRRGDDTPIHTGHMTWNPMVHMGGISLIMFALFGFTWGAMPIDPSRFRGRYAEAYVAAAGPFVNLSLAVLCALADALWVTFGKGVPPHVDHNLHTFLWTGAMLNVFGMFFNLIPIPPLDGSRILADFVPSFDRLMRTEKGALIGLFTFALLFMWGGKVMWGVTFRATDATLETLTRAFGGAWPGRPF